MVRLNDFPKVSLFLLIIFCIFLNEGCKDPHEYEPPQDSLVPPPAPPELITPVDSAFFSITPGCSTEIYFEWTNVDGVELYQIEFSSGTSFDTSFGYTAYSNKTTIYFYSAGGFFWHVRAYSSDWTWYTVWSDTRFFILSTARLEKHDD